MSKVSKKRQVTLPKTLCDKAGINPGNQVEIFEYNGVLSVVKQISGISTGCLKHLKRDKLVTDDESLVDAIQ